MVKIAGATPELSVNIVRVFLSFLSVHTLFKTAHACPVDGDVTTSQKSSTCYFAVIIMSCFLRLPAEVRRQIYGHLFRGLKLSPSRARNRNQSQANATWHILSTCRKIWYEGLPTFYELVTVVLDHEMYLQILNNRMNPQNLSLVRSLEIRNLYMHCGGPDGTALPQCLKKLVLWEREIVPFTTKMQLHNLGDETIKKIVRLKCGVVLKESLLEMWGRSKMPAIFLCVDIGRTTHRYERVCKTI